MSTSLELARMRRLPIGAEVSRDSGSVRFRVWAPNHSHVSVVLEQESGGTLSEWPLASESNGYFSGECPDASAGSLYRFRIDNGQTCFPDPASRFQPQGPHGPSQVIDPAAYVWSDHDWRGPSVDGQVVYEMHIGTFTRAGTWSAAMEHLPRLASLGITTLEVMPIAEFPGEFGWGYDGVNLFAPFHHYGVPDDVRAFIDRAHALGLAVILDVVYNHVGPDGNYLREFTPHYFTQRYNNEWGDAINFDDEAAPVREWVVSNAAYWIDEFHFDGLRLDATQQIFDASPTHVLVEIGAAARQAAKGRHVFVVAENEPQDSRLIRAADRGGYGLDGMWNDDFHHAALVALTGRREAYYTDYGGSPQEFVSLATWGFLYQGQHYSWQHGRRGQPSLDIAPSRLVTFLENHDQVANAPSLDGRRVWQLTSPALYRALTAFWLLSPGTPMFFQGQEYAATTPFLFFAHHEGDLGRAVHDGRAEFMRQFPSAAARDLRKEIPPPMAHETFARCILDDGERDADSWAWRLHADLLAIRRETRAFTATERTCDGTVLNAAAFALRLCESDPRTGGSSLEDRLLIVNLGPRTTLPIAPFPLLAPPASGNWRIRWSSDDARYGGAATPLVETRKGWRLPAQSAVLLAPGAP
jgi:maltooligosyltrehalose trehalohydrolase